MGAFALSTLTLREMAKDRVDFMVDSYRRGGWLHLGEDATGRHTLILFRHGGGAELVQVFPNGAAAGQKEYTLSPEALTNLVARTIEREDGK